MEHQTTKLSRWNSPVSNADTTELLLELTAIRRSVLKLEEEFGAAIRQVRQSNVESARNLCHYLALRRWEMRALQERLADVGLSSLGRSETHVLHSLDAVLRAAHALAGRVPDIPPPFHKPLTRAEGRALLDAHTEVLLGPVLPLRQVRIMVTMPTEAATDGETVRALLEAGMDCMRINCAHDDRKIWSGMIANLRCAERTTGRTCRVLMDLAGPKLRTGTLGSGPRVLKWRPERDVSGVVVAPVRILLHGPGGAGGSPGSGNVLRLDAKWLDRLEPGDEIRFRDLRGKERVLRVVEVCPPGVVAVTEQTAYVGPETVFTACKPGPDPAEVGRATPASVPELPLRYDLRPGDRLTITGKPETTAPPRIACDGTLAAEARIPCDAPEILADVRPGEQVAFDDGKITGRVVAVDGLDVLVEVERTRPGGGRLGSQKGINFPDSDIRAPGLTPDDLADLDFVVEHADLVALSFVRDPADVASLREALRIRGAEHIGFVIKVETRQAFERLPLILLEAMKSPAIGVMIARGDLAVECGYRRLAELQEEVLWVAEAAHVPVIWATQVLENLTRTGTPSRAEVTDAAMSVRAECVMLNKGPYVVEAVRFLDDVLRRMAGHQHKKQALLRSLEVSMIPPRPVKARR
jgi:pyruvate kinase